MQIKTFRTPLENPDSFILDNINIGFVVPEQSINFVLNPETYTLNGYAGNSTFTLDDTEQAFGLNSIRASFIAGTRLENVLNINLDGNTSYTFSVYIKGAGTATLTFNSGGVVIGGETNIISTALWTRYTHTIHLRDGVARNNITVTITGNDTFTANFDGFQVEAKPYATTFISGSRRGNFANIKEYYWNGPAHQSPSTRLSSTTTGGRVITLSDIGVDLLGITGLGMLEVNNVSQNLALRQVSVYNCTNYGSREIELFLSIDSCDYNDYLCKRSDLLKLIKPNRTSKAQPTRMLINTMDCGVPTSDCFYIDVIYSDGLTGEYKNLYNERMSLGLIAFDPFIKSCIENSCTLGVQQLVPNTRNTAVLTNNNVDGTWVNLENDTTRPTSFNVSKAGIGPDGKYYVTGLHVIGGQIYLAVRWTGSVWEAVGPANVTGTAQGRDFVSIGNTIYFTGQITGITGTVGDTSTGNGVNIVAYNIQTNTFSKIAEIDGPTRAIATDGQYLYVGGQFNVVTNTAGVGINARSVARYNTLTNTWDSMGGGMGLGVVANGGFFNNGLPHINSVAIGNDGIVWYGGDFSVPGGENIMRYNQSTSTWIATDGLTASVSPPTPFIAGANSAIVNKILITDNGAIYAAGRFDATGTTNANPTVLNRLDRPISIGKWNGSTWIPLEALMVQSGTNGFATVPATIHEMAYDEISGRLYVAGLVTYAGKQYISPYDQNVNPYTYQLPNNGSAVFYWDGASWNSIPIDYDTPNQTEQGGTIVLGSQFEVGAFSTQLSGQSSGTELPPEFQSNIFMTLFDLDVNSNIQAPAITICNTGCADFANPIITVTGGGEFVSIKVLNNNTTISFANLVLATTETFTIDLSNIVPVFSPNIYRSKLDKTSNLVSFSLSEGNNSIEVFMKDIDNNASMYITYQKQYLSFDSACLSCED